MAQNLSKGAMVPQNATLAIVVLGSNSELLEIADNMATNSGPWPREVFHIEDPDFAKLKNQFPDLPTEITNVKAFALSTKRKVADIIDHTDEVSYLTVAESFTIAGFLKYNS